MLPVLGHCIFKASRSVRYLMIHGFAFIRCILSLILCKCSKVIRIFQKKRLSHRKGEWEVINAYGEREAVFQGIASILIATGPSECDGWASGLWIRRGVISWNPATRGIFILQWVWAALALTLILEGAGHDPERFRSPNAEAWKLPFFSRRSVRPAGKILPRCHLWSLSGGEGRKKSYLKQSYRKSLTWKSLTERKSYLRQSFKYNAISV